MALAIAATNNSAPKANPAELTHKDRSEGINILRIAALFSFTFALSFGAFLICDLKMTSSHAMLSDETYR